LRRENEILRRQAATFTDLARENARLREELRLTGSLDIQTISARVVGASLSGLDRSVVIDKGSESGILRDTAVLAPEGLLGRISWVGSKSAKVLLITDAQSSVGVKIGDKGETGLVSGTGKSVMRIELVERASLDRKDVKTGDVVLTSGQGGVFPPGVPIGIVEDVNLAPRGTSYEITVRPFARMSRLDVVAVAARPESRS
jgi:rod shape-determining protein MreC